MGSPLRILFLEDSLDDFELLHAYLTRAQYNMDFERLETPQDFKRALAEKPWDIILSDYSMPQFDAFQALSILKASGLDLPFIVVSGTVGEETAVGLMKAGAHDYVMKDHPARLAPVIERELQDAKAREAHRASEKALKESESRFRRLYEANMVGIIFGNILGNLTDANDAFLQMVGYSREELDLGRLRWPDITPPEHMYRDQEAILEMKRYGTAKSFKKQFIRKDSERIDVLVGVALLEGSEEDIVGCVVDMTVHKEKAEVERASLRKNHFISTMSHELRTPLHTIISASSMGLEGMLGPVTEKQAEYYQMIFNSGEHLLQLINEILDISKIEADKMHLNIKTIPLQEFMLQVSQLVELLVSNKHQTLEIKLDEDLPVEFNGDATRLRQVLINILCNAIKFTPAEKRISLHVSCPKRTELVFSVRDQGPGIPEDELEFIFNPFEQGHQDNLSDMKGTGLGLPIAKQLIKLHQGRLEIKTQPGHGSEFLIFLPLNLQQSSIS